MNLFAFGRNLHIDGYSNLFMALCSRVLHLDLPCKHRLFGHEV